MLRSGGLIDRGTTAGSREEEHGQEQEAQECRRREDDGIHGESSERSGMTTHLREVSANHIGAAGDRLIRLIDRIAAKNDGVTAYSRLRVDDRVAPDDRNAALYAAGNVEVSEEHKGATGQIAFHLDGTEDAGGVVHLLAGRDEDILPEVDAIAGRLSGSSRGKQKHES